MYIVGQEGKEVCLLIGHSGKLLGQPFRVRLHCDKLRFLAQSACLCHAIHKGNFLLHVQRLLYRFAHECTGYFCVQSQCQFYRCFSVEGTYSSE